MLAVLLCANSAPAGEKKVLTRDEVAKKDTWATEDIFPNAEAWEAEFKRLEGEIGKVAKLKGTLKDGPDALLKAFTLRDDTEAHLDKLMVYASLLADQDTSVGANQELDQRASSLGTKYGEATSWIEPELTAIPREEIDKWMGENEKLAVYEHAIDNLFRQRKHILSPREEELMAMTGQVRRTPYNAYNLLTNADLQFPKIKDENGNSTELSDSAFYLFMRSSDRRVRKEAYEGIVGTYQGVRNTAAALLNGVVQSHLLSVKARNYDSCLAAALDGGNIPVEVYDNLVKTVNDNLGLLHRYQQIRKDALHLTDGVHAYDLFAPFVSEADLDYPYGDAVDMIIDALHPLGDEYLTAMRKGFDSRWVDVYPTKNKRSGAYSSGTFLTQPFILMNYHGTYDSVSTLAHEMGHSMHSYFSRGTQPYAYSNYDIFCAEVASTCNEIILQHYVLEHTTDPKKKLYLLCEFLEGIRGTVFRQTMFSEFEQRVHEMAEADQALTADSLSAEYGKIMKKYYGPAYAHDDLVDSYWIRIPHFYYNFYVYKYATSYCAASNIARRIMAGEPGAVDAYMSFLKGGSSRYPIEMLKMARVDMTTPEPINDAMKQFEGLLDQAEELIREVNATAAK
ncbi:MAG: oligoendopeptidase F [Phycisphaerales bacterium]|nr:oligoendopeptidase F [Phycisphaerales bacterium]